MMPDEGKEPRPKDCCPLLPRRRMRSLIKTSLDPPPLLLLVCNGEGGGGEDGGGGAELTRSATTEASSSSRRAPKVSSRLSSSCLRRLAAREEMSFHQKLGSISLSLGRCSCSSFLLGCPLRSPPLVSQPLNFFSCAAHLPPLPSPWLRPPY